MPYWELHCHLVWATKGRAPMLDEERRRAIDPAMRAACRERGAIVHASGFMPDHVHLAVSIPPRVAVSDLVRMVKGNASYLLNHTNGPEDAARFAWQAEYGALSFSKRALPVVGYVVNQAAHHADHRLWSDYERERPNGKTLDDARPEDAGE